jgi:hypothetical protein
MSSDEIEAAFPALTARKYEVTSPATFDYNCIAYAAGDEVNWWWPDPMNVAHWPAKAPREETIEAFVEAFRLLGYELSPDDAPRDGFEKVAIFALGQLPTHAARLHRGGYWISKLGVSEDIRHDLKDLEGDVYGRVVCVLQRPSQ